MKLKKSTIIASVALTASLAAGTTILAHGNGLDSRNEMPEDGGMMNGNGMNNMMNGMMNGNGMDNMMNGMMNRQGMMRMMESIDMEDIK